MAQIKKDVHRTFPEHSYFQNESGSLALYRILIAYSNYNPQVWGEKGIWGGNETFIFFFFF